MAKKYSPTEKSIIARMIKKGKSHAQIAACLEDRTAKGVQRYCVEAKLTSHNTKAKAATKTILDGVPWGVVLKECLTNDELYVKYGKGVQRHSFFRRMASERKKNPLRGMDGSGLLDKYMPVSRHAGLESGVVFV